MLHRSDLDGTREELEGALHELRVVAERLTSRLQTAQVQRAHATLEGRAEMFPHKELAPVVVVRADAKSASEDEVMHVPFASVAYTSDSPAGEDGHDMGRVGTESTDHVREVRTSLLRRVVSRLRRLVAKLH